MTQQTVENENAELRLALWNFSQEVIGLTMKHFHGEHVPRQLGEILTRQLSGREPMPDDLSRLIALAAENVSRFDLSDATAPAPSTTAQQSRWLTRR